MNNKQELQEAFKKARDNKEFVTAEEAARWLDNYIHKHWVVMGSFHVSGKDGPDGSIRIKPLNIYSGVLLQEGKVKMDKLEADRYDADDAVWLWRDGELYKCPKPEESFKIYMQ